MSIIFFDTETTGLLKNSLVPLEKQPEIIELFALKTNEKGDELATFSELFRVEKPLPVIITRITGITDQKLVGAPVFAEKSREILDFFQSATTIVAHNLSFDAKMLQNEFLRIGMVLDFSDKKLVCTVEQTEYLRGYRLSLTKLHEYCFDTHHVGAHRAEEDVRAVAKCFFDLKRKNLI